MTMTKMTLTMTRLYRLATTSLTALTLTALPPALLAQDSDAPQPAETAEPLTDQPEEAAEPLPDSTPDEDIPDPDPDLAPEAAEDLQPEAQDEQAQDEQAQEEQAQDEQAQDDDTQDDNTQDTQPPRQQARAAQETRDVGADWPFYGGDAQARRYTPLTQITRDNVASLEVAFEYRTGDMPEGTAEGKYSPETTPLKVGDDLLMCSAMNTLISVDAATGEENWRYDPGVPNEAIPYGATCRGVTLYDNPDAAADDLCATRVIQATLDAKLIAVDASTGSPCEDFGENGMVDLWQDIGERVPGWYAVTAPPAIVRGVVVTGAQVKDGQAEDAPSGVVRGFDAVTGELAWAWDLAAPEDHRDGPPEGEVYTRGTPNMWTAATGDEELGLVYLPMGNSSVDYYGSNRSEAENEYATAVVALDVTTGEEAWTFQTLRNDVWDYDLGSQVSLIDWKGTPALIVPSKQGDIYILDRATGAPLTPVGQLTDLPQGNIEPDYIADTQPISEWHSLRKDPLTERDMWGFTPIDQLWCRIQFRQANYVGYLTPPSADKPWIQYPGYNGGSDWGSVAVDPERGVLIANYNDIPNYNRLLPRDEVEERNLRAINEPPAEGEPGEGDPQAGAPYGIDVNAGWRVPFTGMPCTNPPFGGIRAIDLATGDTLWDRPLGTARRNGPFGIPSGLPFDIGTPNNGGAVVTASGLIFIAAATDNLFRAIDIETGETVWQAELPAGGQANPIAYEVDGRQYVMVAATGHHFMETPVGDYMIAWALPED